MYTSMYVLLYLYELHTGMRALQCSSISTLRSALDKLNGHVHPGHWEFAKLFDFAFRYLLTVCVDTAVCLQTSNVAATHT